MADFPPVTMSAKEDSKYRSDSKADPAMRTETDSGWVLSRPRYTRLPRKTFVTGFTGISQADYTAFGNFYDSKFGGSSVFTWTDPTSGVTYNVRFKGGYQAKYVGMGLTFLWDVTNITLEQY
jgi:hypothetical protein